MLNIYFARENTDKDRFMFDCIAEGMKAISARKSPFGRILLLVPDQYTLQAEKNAIDYLNVRGFIDLEVLSLSRLGQRVLDEVGYGRESYIDKYGKFMLLSRLLYRNRDKLQTFSNLERSADFAEKLSNMISELKNFGVSPDKLAELTGRLKGDSLLKRKLSDVEILYRGYEEEISGVYMDIADKQRLFIDKMKDAALIKNAEVWFSGFDYMSPLNMDAVIELTKYSAGVNIVLTADTGDPKNGDPLFASTNELAQNLFFETRDVGLEAARISIEKEFGDKYLIPDRAPEIEYIEKALFTYPLVSYTASASVPPVLCLVKAANYRAEAESAAVRISDLVRREGMRYRDILVLCNDLGKRALTIKRVFADYGLPLFVDKRRGLEHDPVLEFILALPEISSGGWLHRDVFRLLKTGLSGIGREDWEELENYVIKYDIRGNKWKKPFTHGIKDYSEEQIAAFNVSREKICVLIHEFEASYKKGKTGSERTEGLLSYLIETAKLPERIEEAARALEAEGKLEYAAETTGIWDVVTGIFEQMSTVLGDHSMSMEEYAIVLRTGFESVNMGILPPSSDRIVLGTMQRTRSGKAKAVFVLGANDRILPAYTGDETILSNDEKIKLETIDIKIGRNDENMQTEEQLAIYRNLSKAEKYLFLSYSVSGSDGKDTAPSIIFERLRRLFPNIPVEKDIRNSDVNPIDFVYAKEETIDHLTENLRRWASGELLPEVWKDVYLWLKENIPERAERIESGLAFRNRRESISEKYIAELYAPAVKAVSAAAPDAAENALQVITASPSALEKFSHCPFTYFVDRIIRLKERRVFAPDSRNEGDIYHEVLMRYAQTLTAGVDSISDPKSKWHTITKEESDSLVSGIFDSAATEYNEGMFTAGVYESYRSERMKSVAQESAWAAAEQVRSGKIKDMYLETGFGTGEKFPPITIEKDGKTVQIRGRIDRIDVLDGNHAGIIDYKSGATKFNLSEVTVGWQLQLMIYLKAVSESYDPAGVFYFKIQEPHINITGKKADPAALQDEIKKSFRLDGIAVNDPAIVDGIGMKTKTKEKEDFEAIRDTVSGLIEKLCGGLISGTIDAHPMEARETKTPDNKKQTACTYCSYKSICNFDSLFES